MNYTIDVVKFRVTRETARRLPRDQRKLLQPNVVAALAREIIPDDGREHFGMFMLNAQNELVAYHEISMGTLTASLVSPREVFGAALRTLGVAAVILVHNHPSGSVTPSREDMALTKTLVKAGKLLDILVLDHVIIDGGESRDFYAFALSGELSREGGETTQQIMKEV